MLRRRQLPLLVLLAGLLAVTLVPARAGKGRRAPCRDCDVILVSIDTLRADHLGCYGYPRPTSPHLDAFSEESVRFRTAIAHAPSTTPSHASIFTSLLPEHHGARRARGRPMAEEIPTLAEILREAGYRTVSFNGGGQVAADYGFDRGFEIYASDEGRLAGKVRLAVDWMKRHPDEPVFVFLHTYEVHAPYRPPARFMDQLDSGYRGELGDEISSRLLIEINDGRTAIDAADRRHIVNAYDAEIRSMDLGFAQLVRYLAESGRLDRTVLVFTSDHGEEFGEHGQFGRHSHALHDELLRVPLLIRLPGGKFAGKVVEAQVRGIDILPTITHLLGLKHPESIDGSSLVPLMKGRRGADRVAVSQIDTTHETVPTSIRTGREKLIQGGLGFAEGADPGDENRVEYFLLSRDPAEQDDRSRDPAHADAVLRLQRQLERILASRERPDPEPVELDPTERERLEALGYLD